MQLLILILLLFGTHAVIAQENAEQHPLSLHAVILKDKSNTPYSVLRPQDFLSARAINRRQKQGIPIDQKDLPVSPSYLQAVLQQGVDLQNKSKWLNTLIIHTQDRKKLQAIEQLDCVAKVKAVGEFRKAKAGKKFPYQPPIDTSKHTASHYGHAHTQIAMLDGIPLHQMGYRGQGVQVAIVDGGFMNAYRVAQFDSMYQQDRLLGMQDFVDGDQWVYQHSTHGTNVLSTMAANTPNLMVGTAPDASYYLFKTEDTRNEYPAEEYNWVAALEYADSVGADVVNSSLGYSVFRKEEMSYTYSDVNGQTAIISQGAQIATDRGLFIVNAAGNDGSRDWHYLFSPADVSGVLTVAAVGPQNKRTSFSAWGPTADQRLKPDVAALGLSTTLTSIIEYGVSHGDGTSYASPVLCGMVASLKQAFPDVPNQQLRQAIKQSGHQAHAPDTSLGYGVPSFLDAYIALSPASIHLQKGQRATSNQKIIKDKLFLFVEGFGESTIEVDIYSLAQKPLLHYQLNNKQTFQKINIPRIDQLPDGPLWVVITEGTNKQHLLLGKHNK